MSSILSKVSDLWIFTERSSRIYPFKPASILLIRRIDRGGPFSFLGWDSLVTQDGQASYVRLSDCIVEKWHEREELWSSAYGPRYLVRDKE